MSLTFGNVCGLGVDSKLVLNRVSISVDLPKPVSPNQLNVKDDFNGCLLCPEDQMLINGSFQFFIRLLLLTDAHDIEDESILNTFVHQLIWQTVKTHMTSQFQRTQRQIVLKKERKPK